jgi:hypothetical protein
VPFAWQQSTASAALVTRPSCIAHRSKVFFGAVLQSAHLAAKAVNPQVQLPGSFFSPLNGSANLYPLMKSV